jgi:hypothetical protein
MKVGGLKVGRLKVERWIVFGGGCRMFRYVIDLP